MHILKLEVKDSAHKKLLNVINMFMFSEVNIIEDINLSRNDIVVIYSVNLELDMIHKTQIYLKDYIGMESCSSMGVDLLKSNGDLKELFTDEVIDYYYEEILENGKLSDDAWNSISNAQFIKMDDFRKIIQKYES